MFSLVPRCQALGVTEEHLDADVDTELGVFGHFFALIPGQRRAQVFGESLDGCGESVTDGFGGVVGPTLLIVEGSSSAVRPRSAAKHCDIL